MLNYKENPFYVLAVSPQLPKSGIVAAYEDAVLDHPDEKARLAEARQNILISRRRLEWELRWFPETDPKDISRALATIDGLGEAQIKSLAGLSKINFIAYRRKKITETHVQLATLFGELDPEEARKSINRDRDKGGFTQVDQEIFEVEWTKLRGDLVKSALDAVSDMAEPGEAMSRLVHSMDKKSQATRAFVQEVVLRFDEWTAPNLSQIEKKIQERLVSDAALTEADVKALAEHLRAWDKFRAPVRLQRRKIDAEDERSLKVFEILAEALNTKDKRGDSNAERELILVLFPVILEVFKDLPSAKRFLDSLEEYTTKTRVLIEFETALSKANKEQSGFAAQLENGQFRAKGSGIAGQLYLSARALHDMDGKEHTREVWVGLINLAGKLLTEGRPPDALRRITHALKSFGQPPDIECKTELDKLDAVLKLIEVRQIQGGRHFVVGQDAEDAGHSWAGWVFVIVLGLIMLNQCSL